jgi:hypothetical protein
MRIGSTPTELNERLIEEYLRHRSTKQGLWKGDRAALKRLLSVLRETGTIASAMQPPLTPHEQIFEAFSHYLREERGLAPISIVHHLPFIRLFLHEVCPGGATCSFAPRAGSERGCRSLQTSAQRWFPTCVTGARSRRLVDCFSAHWLPTSVLHPVAPSR